MRHFSPGTPRKLRRFGLVAIVPSVMATLALTSIASAHDFWLIPDLFTFAGDSVIHVNGRSGTRFPTGSAVQPTRVVDARIIGASSQTKIAEMTVDGTSLRLHQRPASPGQYLIVVSLTPRTTRATAVGLLRFLRAEGGATEAARLERENTVSGADSVVFTAASYAATVVQVGRAGPRAFSLTAGYPLEFVPMHDPAYLHVGDTLHVKVLGAGKSVPQIGVDASPAVDSAAASSTAGWVTLGADANGVVHVPLTRDGPWILRSAYVGRRTGGATNEWDVSRSTYVFNVGAHR